jgi:hypothetical protein
MSKREFHEVGAGGLAALAAVRPPDEMIAKYNPDLPTYWARKYFVPVSFVAKDWKVTPRRIRALLAAGRLEGRLQDNGYWEVAYPYNFTFGRRGPALKRSQKPERSPAPNQKTTLQELGKS